MKILEGNQRKTSVRRKRAASSPMPEAQQSPGKQATPANASPVQEHVEDNEMNINEEPASTDRIQILELQGDNPIISFNGSVYSCHWAQGLGTDLYFAKKKSVSETEDEYQPRSITNAPLHSLKSHDLLGLGAARLIAMPVELRERPASVAESVQHHLKIPIPADADEPTKRQAAFLEQLAAIKARKGERDTVVTKDTVPGPARRKPGPKRGQPQTGRIRVARPRNTPQQRADVASAASIRSASTASPSNSRTRSSRGTPRQKGVVRFGLYQGPDHNTQGQV